MASNVTNMKSKLFVPITRPKKNTPVFPVSPPQNFRVGRSEKVFFYFIFLHRVYMRGFFTIKIWDFMTNYDMLSLYLLLIKGLFHIISIFLLFFLFFYFLGAKKL